MTIAGAEKLLLLRDNWDGAGASQIHYVAIQAAFDGLREFMSHNSSVPQWTPTQQSGVQLDWHENGVDLEIALEPDAADGYVVFTDRTRLDAEWDGPLVEHLETLRKLFRDRLVS